MKRNTIGPKIKKLRKKNNLTQLELSQTLGYKDKSMIAHIEKGDSDMTYEKILLLLRNYALDANELFDVERIDKKLKDVEEIKRNKNQLAKIAVYIHGNKGSFEEASDYDFLKDEYDVVGLDYQDGNPWDLQNEIQKNFSKLIEGYKEVIVIANSIGAFYTYQFLSNFNIKHAFFISPLVNMPRMIENLLSANGITMERFEKEKIIVIDSGVTLSFEYYQKVKHEEDNFVTRIDILYGSKDEIISEEDIISFLEKHPYSKLVVKNNSKHYFHTKEEKTFIRNWIMLSL